VSIQIDFVAKLWQNGSHRSSTKPNQVDITHLHFRSAFRSEIIISH